MSPPRAPSPAPPPAPPGDDLGLRVTPEALRAITAAVERAGPGRGLRLWVEPGIRPQAKMMVDRPQERDRRVAVGTIELYVDPLSERFLRGAEIQLVERGGQTGFHVVGPGLPSLEPPPAAPTPAAAAEGGGVIPAADRAKVEEAVRAALKQVYDPEIPMNLVDLGLIYGFDWVSDSELRVRMSLTSVGCPATEQIAEEVRRVSLAASGAARVTVDVVWDPPWTPERMSLLAKRQFGYA